jgi:hypothetical protein
MERQEFEKYMQKYADKIEQIRQSAHELHQGVNQTYGDSLPYGYHLDMVVNGIRDFGHLVCACEDDVLPLFFGGYYHDSIEDARLTYNDVMKTARHFLKEEQAFLATEIAYALTNDKGRTRTERAGEKYYQGIRQTPYAPFVKLCDRLANITYSCAGVDGSDPRMKEVYKSEMPHFLAAITTNSDDPRFQVPHETVVRLAEFQEWGSISSRIPKGPSAYSTSAIPSRGTPAEENMFLPWSMSIFSSSVMLLMMLSISVS